MMTVIILSFLKKRSKISASSMCFARTLPLKYILKIIFCLYPVSGKRFNFFLYFFGKGLFISEY